MNVTFEYNVRTSCLSQEETAEVMDGFDRGVFICQQYFEDQVRKLCDDIHEVPTGLVHVGDDCLDDTVAELKIVEFDFNEDIDEIHCFVEMRIFHES